MLYRFLFLFFEQAFRDFNLIQIGRIEDLACTEHLVDTGKDHSGDGDERPLYAPSLGDTFVFYSKVRRFFGDDRCMGDLDQGRFQLVAGPGDFYGFFLSGGLVVSGGQSGPAA